MTRLLTLDEAAEALRTSREALKKRMWRREVDHVKDGARYYMTERQVEEHIAKCTIIKRKAPPGVGTFL